MGGDLPLKGRTIGVTADRKAEEQARMLTDRGGTVVLGATIRISSLLEDASLRAATEEVMARPPDYLVASTGFGIRTWLQAAEGWGCRDELLAALSSARVANRGAKAASATKALGLAEWWRAPDERFDQAVHRLLDEPLEGRRVVLQLHGVPEPQACEALVAAGADVVEVDAYRSGLPEDPSAALALIDTACEGRLDAVTFTTAPAVHNLFALAGGRGRADALLQAFNGGVIAACVGPVCAEGARDEGISEPLVPPRPRLVPMIETLSQRLRES